jgi:hypothetical protein
MRRGVEVIWTAAAEQNPHKYAVRWCPHKKPTDETAFRDRSRHGRYTG